MNNNYQEQIVEAQKYINLISATMKEFLKVSTVTVNSKNKKNIEKQKKLFEKFNSGLDYKKYITETNNNIKNEYDYLENNKINQIEEILKNDVRKFDSKLINDLMNKLKNGSIKENVMFLSQEYNNALEEKRRYEKLKNLPEKTTEDQEKNKESSNNNTQQELNKYNDSIDQPSVLLAGPKNISLINRLTGKDTNIKNIGYLYGLAGDILNLMQLEQMVKVDVESNVDRKKIFNVAFPYIMNEKKEQIFRKYEVNSLDELLDKYEKIRTLYYKQYNKLSIDNKQKYEISKFDSVDIETSLGDHYIDYGLLNAFKNEKFKFPPSKDKMISLINERIMNGKNFKVVTPRLEDNVTIEPESYDEYNKVFGYYKNLTKNMSVEEVTIFYKKVKEDMYKSFNSYINKDMKIHLKQSYFLIMQQLFCEIIFNKKNMKYIDQTQYKNDLNKILEEILKDDLNIVSNHTIKTENQQEKNNTMASEYIKYRVRMNIEKKEHISFNQFCEMKYGLENQQSEVEIEKMVEEELKGKKI